MICHMIIYHVSFNRQSKTNILKFHRHSWTFWGSHLNIHRLDQAVQEYYTESQTPVTHNTYEVVEYKYLTFCVNFNLSPIPTLKILLCYIVVCLGQEFLASFTIQTCLSGIHQI